MLCWMDVDFKMIKIFLVAMKLISFGCKLASVERYNFNLIVITLSEYEDFLSNSNSNNIKSLWCVRVRVCVVCGMQDVQGRVTFSHTIYII